MPRYKLTIEYNGQPYHGWQRQDDAISIQEVLETAVEKLCGQHCITEVAGRTDAGVHALGQVAHVDIPKPFSAHTVQEALNAHMVPHPICVLKAEEVGDDFHARFSATARRYLYRILNRRPPLTVQQGLMWRMPHPLNAEAMQTAAQRLVGHHDFTTFRNAQCQAKSPIKTLDELRVERIDDQIHVHAYGRSFLHNQVRSMVGTLTEVGRGAWTADDVTAALKAKDRKRCGVVAPADGLYLTEVKY